MKYFTVSEESIEFIHKLYDTNDKKIAKDVKILKEWMKQQRHYPQIAQHFDRIEELGLLQSKFHVEKAKERIEDHVTLRTVNKDFYRMIARDDLPPPSTLPLVITALPNQGPKFERFILLWVQNPDACTTDNFIESLLPLLELCCKHEYSYGYRVIFDCKNITFNLLKTTDFVKLRRLIILMMKGYTSKFLGMHLINAQPSIQIGIAALKVVMKEKLVKRIIIHENLESLHEIVPEKYLPEEFGGSAGTIKDVLVKYDAFVESNRVFLREADQFGTDESLRIGKLAADYTYGLDGTFKKLDLD